MTFFRGPAAGLDAQPPGALETQAATGPSFASARPSATATQDLIVLLAGLLLLVGWDAAGLDLPISRLFGNAGGFAWRDHWLTAGVLHTGARWAAWGVCAVLLVNVWRPLPPARGLARAERIWWLSATLACAALIPLLKHFSLTSCPWSLGEFGGTARYVSHWAFGQRDGGPGGCFPAGHATAAFCFLSGYFALRQTAPLAARRWLLATLVAGVILGAVQVVRGAHFVSHSLWTGWWCWALTVTSFHAARRAQPRG